MEEESRGLQRHVGAIIGKTRSQLQLRLAKGVRAAESPTCCR